MDEWRCCDVHVLAERISEHSILLAKPKLGCWRLDKGEVMGTVSASFFLSSLSAAKHLFRSSSFRVFDESIGLTTYLQ